MDTDQQSLLILETDRLLLRRQLPEDIPALVDLWSHPKVTRFLGGPRDRAWLQSVFEETAQSPFAETYDLWPLVEKASSQLIGHCGLLDKEVEGNPEIELNYIVAVQAWGKGYATEIGLSLVHNAFTVLKLPRLVALIKPENTASARVAQKIGLHFEKDVIRPGGEARQVYVIEKGMPSSAGVLNHA